LPFDPRHVDQHAGLILNAVEGAVEGLVEAASGLFLGRNPITLSAIR